MEIINKRRSVRVFKENAPLSKEQIELILRAGMQAPSAVNEQPWEFIVVTKPDILKELSKMSNYASFLEKAGCAIIVIANKTKVKSTLYPQDLAACTQNILLASTALNLGSCWIGTYPKEDRMKAISDYFSLGVEAEPFSVIAIGTLADPDSLKYLDRYNPRVVHYNGW